MEVAIFLFIIPKTLEAPLARRLRGLGGKLGSLVPGLGYDLRELGEADAGKYVARALLNSVLWGILLTLLISFFLFTTGRLKPEILAQTFSNNAALSYAAAGILPAVGSGIFVTALLLAFLLYYPHILARKLAETVDKDLIFALKDLQLQIGSGVSLFNAMVNVSKAGYGNVSKQFDSVVKDISAGEAEDAALEKMAAHTESEFMKRTVWQMITALRGGASLEGALSSIISVLKRDQASRIRTFIHELNLWALVYMIVAVAVPGLGSTVLIVISAFGGIVVTEMTYVFALVACFIAEIVIIGFIKSRRPIVHL
ncbi:MAG: type II secretion system F family protein [Candidatus Micrarchaeota archaeon]|nr:type II secretion system F family protein [Candidatus Micrarchaeota archaeon]